MISMMTINCRLRKRKYVIACLHKYGWLEEFSLKRLGRLSCNFLSVPVSHFTCSVNIVYYRSTCE